MGPDVVFVVDAAVVFTQFLQNHLREEYLTGAGEMDQSSTYK